MEKKETLKKIEKNLPNEKKSSPPKKEVVYDLVP
jgi:hypothetical protein